MTHFKVYKKRDISPLTAFISPSVLATVRLKDGRRLVPADEDGSFKIVVTGELVKTKKWK